MSDPKDPKEVTRLVDMVVEEVSLVDRAANLRRFLVVKREEPMPQKKPEDDNADPKKPKKKFPPPKKGAPPGKGKPPAEGDDDGDRKPAKKVSGELMSAATAALEVMTSAVERLADAPDEEAQELVEEIVEELGKAADELAEAAGVETAKRDSAVPTTLAEIKDCIAKVAELVEAAKDAAEHEAAADEEDEDPAPTPAGDETKTADELSRIATSLETLTASIREQGQRIGRLEKGLPLPNSQRPEGTSSPPRAVQWPADMNSLPKL